MEITYTIRQFESGGVVILKDDKAIFHTRLATNPKMNETELEVYLAGVLDMRDKLKTIDFDEEEEEEDDI